MSLHADEGLTVFYFRWAFLYICSLFVLPRPSEYVSLFFFCLQVDCRPSLLFLTKMPCPKRVYKRVLYAESSSSSTAVNPQVPAVVPPLVIRVRTELPRSVPALFCRRPEAKLAP